MQFKLTLSEIIQQFLQDNLGPDAPFKTIFIGDPLLIGQSYLPALCIVKRGSNYPVVMPTGTEERSHRITVRAVFNKKDEFGKSPTEVSLQKTMENWVEGVDPATNKISEHSILGILRKNYTLGSLVISNEVDVEYLLNNNRSDVVTMEADLNCIFEERLVLDNRV